MYIISPEVLVTHTNELSQILKCIEPRHDVDPKGDRDHAAHAQALPEQELLAACDYLCQLATLDNVSPDVEHALVCLAKKLKKNVALDMIVFGDDIKQASKGTASSIPLLGTHPRPTALTSSNPIVSLSSMHKLTCMVWCHTLFCLFPDITSPSHLTHTSSS